MRKIEHEYADEVVVIGVHSGKYIAERETTRIREASLRFDIAHPVVNDRQFRVWRSYAVNAWPTLVVIDKNGYVVGSHAGEFTFEMLKPLLDTLVSMAGTGRVARIPHVADTPAIAPSFLRYPGKIEVDGNRIAIADTGNRRVLLGTLEGAGRMRIGRQITEVTDRRIPAGIRPLQAPQGMAFSGNTLFGTDAEAHIVFAIDLTDGSSRVLAGTGDQLRTRADREGGALSSPWDIVVVDEMAYVAMAGVHQIWAMQIETGKVSVHSGNGGEDIVDGPQLQALLAQPMGITTDGARLYFADSESSAIRWSDLDAQGSVGTLIGTGLFDFGDVDGKGEKVRMQHQQGVAFNPDGRLLVADSYNNALKWLDINTREATTWLRGFHEPGGVCIANGNAYVADTNAHRIMVVELATGNMMQLEILS